MQAQTVTDLTPNNKTNTTVATNGNTLNVTTTSVQGLNAFNAFSSFKVGQTSTVNLMLPNGTTHLINLVYGSAIQIDGTLNGILNNKIGGHIVFADPFGMVVGSTGVLNVGSLTAIAPTAAFMNGVITSASPANFTADANSVSQLLAGTAPINPGSLIRIDGRINALTSAAIYADQIQINGTVQANADARHQATFVAAVNTNGLAQATDFVDQGGTILIVGGALTVAGVLDVSGIKGGSVSVQGSTVTTGFNSSILANATSAAGTTATTGGSINVYASGAAQLDGAATVAGVTSGGTLRYGAGTSLAVTGSVDATGKTGGTITVDAPSMIVGSTEVADTIFDVSGIDAGGTMFVGRRGITNDYVQVADSVQLLANATGTTGAGTGGAITVWGNNFNQFHGIASATGSTTGGEIILGGSSINVSNTIDASGKTGGGAVRIGWSNTDKAGAVVVRQSAVLKADALSSGNGGTIDIWGSTLNIFSGAATARGGAVSGSGNGGTVRISGQTGQMFAGVVDTSAPRGAIGSLTMDQFETCIVDASGPNCSSVMLWSSLDSSSTAINVVTTNRLRFGGNTNGTLSSVNAAFTTQGAGKTVSFTGGSIVFNANSRISTTGGNVSLTATAGGIDMGNGSISTSGGSVTLKASDSVSMTSGALINTRKGIADAVASTGTSSSGNSGSITINGTGISIGTGAGLYAHGSASKSDIGGAVNLVAFERADPLWNAVAQVLNVTKADVQVDIGGTIKGGTVLVGATAQGIAGISSNSTIAGTDENGNPAVV
ncbi:MAG: leukotoxin LktA family filamentous adhesin, partial [Bdellovibrionales bacterium]|nr:leukotoxin LktA family filamentous adhesin [Ramlibacter sp.]